MAIHESPVGEHPVFYEVHLKRLNHHRRISEKGLEGVWQTLT